MISNLLVSAVVMASCVAVQCVVVGYVLKLLIYMDRRRVLRATVLRATCALCIVLFVMLAGIVAQIAIWAGVFRACGEFNDFATAFYHSTVNFTTLGYGDVVMSEKRRLLGALEAANGIMMIGLTTSLLFAVLHALIRDAWEQELRQAPGAAEPREN